MNYNNNEEYVRDQEADRAEKVEGMVLAIVFILIVGLCILLYPSLEAVAEWILG